MNKRQRKKEITKEIKHWKKRGIWPPFLCLDCNLAISGSGYCGACHQKRFGDG